MRNRELANLHRRSFRLIMLADVIVLSGVMYGTNFVRFGLEWPNSVSLFFTSFSIATIVIFGTLYFGGLYEREPRLGTDPILPRVFRLMLFAGGGVALVTLSSSGFFREFTISANRGLPFPFINLVVLIILGTAFLTLNRIFSRRMIRAHLGQPRVLLVGTKTDVKNVSDQFSNGDMDFLLVGIVTSPGALAHQLDTSAPSDVFIVSPSWLGDHGKSLGGLLDRQDLNVMVRVRGIDTMLGIRQVSQVAGLPFVQLKPTALPLSQAHLKRLLDLGLLVAFAPVWLIMVLLVALYQLIVVGWPIFFIQRRVGLGNETFPMLKFRTMRLHAEDASGPVLSSDDDDRVIPACRWLRATRMDELPQLFNVLAGHMSIVGPRPERPELIAAFEEGVEWYRRRHSLRPGLTGLAQVYGRYDTRPEFKLGYDLHYAVNWSVVLDLDILLRTVLVVLGRRV